MSDDFHPALQRPNVTLVKQAVVRATAQGVVSAYGREHALDVLAAATGFNVAGAGAPFEVSGRGGQGLDAVWAGVPRAHLGSTVAGFPNLFDVRHDVQARFKEELHRRLARSVWNTGACRSWYLVADGSNRALWPDFTFRLRTRLSHFDWRDFHAIGAPE